MKQIKPDGTTVSIFIAGAGMRGSGYPNAWNTIRILRGLEGVRVIECGTWLPEGVQLWRLGKGSRLRAAFQLGRLVVANTVAAFRLLLNNRSATLTYVPYPSLFLLWLLSWLPISWRPRCICDAYITVWDTVYQDRRLGNAASRVARMLLRFESRALRTAKVVLVDTSANAEHLSRLFQVPHERIRAFPLALEASTSPSFPQNTQRKRVVRVLFIGTFVPLQGTSIIAQAIDSLRNNENLEFVLIGDGQSADEAALYVADHPAVTWLRGWQPSHVLAEHLANADICLGVFGGHGKAERVMPFKLYLALAAGKAIITQDTYSTPNTPAIPALTVRPTADALKSAILDLASNPELRSRLQIAATLYYREHLGRQAISRVWANLIQELSEK